MYSFSESVLSPQTLRLQVVRSLLDHVIDSLTQSGRRFHLSHGSLGIVVTVTVPCIRHHDALLDSGGVVVEANVGRLVGEAVTRLVHVQTVHLIRQVVTHCIVRVLQITG